MRNILKKGDLDPETDGPASRMLVDFNGGLTATRKIRALARTSSSHTIRRLTHRSGNLMCLILGQLMGPSNRTIVNSKYLTSRLFAGSAAKERPC